MSNRSYKGDPVDMSWNTPPWKADGETVAASDDGEKGSMTTTDWPETATAKDELTDKQQRIIKTAAKYPYLDSAWDLYQQSDLDEYVSDAYPSQVLTQHWREWLGDNVSNTTDNNQDSGVESKYCNKLTEGDVKEMRKRALDGDTAAELADDYPVNRSSIGKALRGYNWGHVKTPPALRYDRSEGVWTIHSENADGINPGSKHSEQTELIENKTENYTENVDKESELTTYEPQEKAANGVDYGKVALVVVVVSTVLGLIKSLWSNQ